MVLFNRQHALENNTKIVVSNNLELINVISEMAGILQITRATDKLVALSTKNNR